MGKKYVILSEVDFYTILEPFPITVLAKRDQIPIIQHTDAHPKYYFIHASE